MHFFIVLLYITASFFSYTLAKDHDVAVGDNAALSFNPSSLTDVENGDTVTFHFISGNHTLTQSTFDEPCKYKEGGVDSGYQDVQNVGGGSRLHYTITVNDASTPLWFFCAQTAHCTRGMVFAVNPTTDKPFSEFQATAKGITPGSEENPAYTPTVNSTDSAVINSGATSAVMSMTRSWLALGLAVVNLLLPLMMRHLSSFPLDDDLIQLVLCHLPDFSSLRSATLSCQAIYRVWRAYPVQIEYAVAANAVGCALPQALRLARYELSTDGGNADDAYPENDGPVRMTSREVNFMTTMSENVRQLEDIFSRRHKCRRLSTSQLTYDESRRFRQGVYRILVFCRLYGVNDRLHRELSEDWDDEAVDEAREQRYMFLKQYSTVALHEIHMVAQFLQQLYHSLNEVSDPDIGVTMDEFGEFALACGPLAYLKCYQDHSLDAFTEYGECIDEFPTHNWDMFAGYLRNPLKRIMDARKAVLKDDDWTVILDSVPDDAQATCDKCHAVKGFDLYDESNYDNLWISAAMDKTALPGAFKGNLRRHNTEGALIAHYFFSSRFSYAEFLQEMFAYSSPLPPAQKEQQSTSSGSMSLEEWADALDDDAGNLNSTPAAPPSTSTAGSTELSRASTAGPWDGITTSNALCADCIKAFVVEFLPQWWVDRRRRGGAAIPDEKCWYGWNCRTMTHKPLHANKLNHFCKPSRGEGA
ncbi:hypothetical protein BD626DRAFT_547677 [Schizophyllum amplum]|uniref:Cupredoxin n=1 Tax=Schizophyllum amplum TaxID=97359 RepID=A0A550CGD3_9AGAR|nr:hypothetical protein BD626DRAFT_547677 [Auriculariopsis ampla]